MKIERDTTQINMEMNFNMNTHRVKKEKGVKVGIVLKTTFAYIGFENHLYPSNSFFALWD